MTSTTANFGVWTNGDRIKYFYRDLHKIDNSINCLTFQSTSVDAIGKYKKDDPGWAL